MTKLVVLVKHEDLMKAASPAKARKNKVAKVFKEWSEHKLHSGSKHGPKVPYKGKVNKQAVAIALRSGEGAAKKARKRNRKK